MSIHYPFPVIRHIEDVLPHIEGRDEFIVADKGDYKVINYVMMGNDTFPSMALTSPYPEANEIVDQWETAAILRECRGLIFDGETGLLVSRSFHKFFNKGERENLVPDLSIPHVWMDKIDGSMMRSFTVKAWNGAIRWGTKMGITDTAMRAETFVARQDLDYDDFAKTLIAENQTPIFEWVSPADRIVVEYPDENLILTAIRNNETGEYMDLGSMEMLARHWDIPVVSTRPLRSIDNPKLDTMCEASARNEEGVEGWVVRFNDGHMVKLKTDWYVKLHRAKEFISRERYVVQAILDEKIDDLLPLLPDADKAKLRTYTTSFWGHLSLLDMKLQAMRQAWQPEGRKAFAMNSDTASGLRSLMFKVFDNSGSTLQAIKETIAKNLTNEQAFGKVKWMFPSAQW